MKNRDVDKYNLSDKEKAELKRLRNTRRRMKRRKQRTTATGLTLAGVQKRITELQLNGAR